MNVDHEELRTEVWPQTRQQFENSGFILIRSLFTPNEIRELREPFAQLMNAGRAGSRHILRRSPEMAALAKSERITGLLTQLSGSMPFPVRGLLFDKTPAANWQVSWHQDLTISVKERVEVPEYGPWSVKEEVNHAEAPVSLLERMLTVRIHLDDAEQSNGALRVIAGSHRFGKLNQEGVKCAAAGASTICETSAGDVLVMRPLLLHASSPASHPHHRRVIHIEYALDVLPDGLEWFESAK